MTEAERAEFEEMKKTLRYMDTRIKELEGSSPPPSMSEVDKRMFIREAVRRDMLGDSSLRKAWNAGRRRL